MPIANCFFASAPHELDAETIVLAWSARSGIEADQMTINVVHGQQAGNRYEVIAWLYLPSLCSEPEVVALSEGLAAALEDALHVPSRAVQVLTSIITSGLVVEAGRTLRW